LRHRDLCSQGIQEFVFNCDFLITVCLLEK